MRMQMVVTEMMPDDFHTASRGPAVITCRDASPAEASGGDFANRLSLPCDKVLLTSQASSLGLEEEGGSMGGGRPTHSWSSLTRLLLDKRKRLS